MTLSLGLPGIRRDPGVPPSTVIVIVAFGTAPEPFSSGCVSSVRVPFVIGDVTVPTSSATV